MDRKQKILKLLELRKQFEKGLNNNTQNNEVTHGKETGGFELVKTIRSTDSENPLINDPLIRPKEKITNKIGNIVGLAFLTLFLESIFILISVYI